MKKSLRLAFLLLILIPLISNSTFAATYYSRNSGAWNVLANWSLTSHTVTNAPASLPTASDVVLIGNGHVMTIPNGYTALASSVTISDDASVCSLTIGDNTASTAAVLNITNGIAIQDKGSVVVGGLSSTAGRTGTLTATSIALTGTGSLTLGNTSTNVSTVTTTGAVSIGSSSTITIGSNANASHVFTCGGTFTISSGGTLQTGGDTGGTHTLTITGALSNSGTINNAAGTDQPARLALP